VIVEDLMDILYLDTLETSMFSVSSVIGSWLVIILFFLFPQEAVIILKPKHVLVVWRTEVVVDREVEVVDVTRNSFPSLKQS